MHTAARIFSTLTLRDKLLLVILATATVVIVTMAGVIVGSEWHNARSLLLSNVQTQAQLLGKTANATLVFQDRSGAEELLQALHLSPYIRAGILYDANGGRLAEYLLPEHSNPALARLPLQNDAYLFGEDWLDVVQPIYFENEKIGYIYLRADLGLVHSRLRWAAAATTLAAALALTIGILLTRRLREVVAGPVLRLAQVARDISDQGNYSRRAPIEGRDEVATLARDFNSMIEQIEHRNEALIRELDQRRVAEARLDHLAHFDPLTGLPNRRHFQNRIDAAVKLSMQFEESLSLMFIDLDNFKYVNDSLGHEVGDELLRHVALTLHATLRASDIICRLGGDEFAVIIEGGADERVLAGLATKLIEVLAEPIRLGEHGILVGCSIGIARCPIDCTSVEGLLRAADAAMYDAKAAGKSTFRFFHYKLQERTERRLRLEIALREDLTAARGFFLLYQPVLDAASKRVVAVEALCRWQHPDIGLLPPGEFIPIAEESDLILRLGAWVLRTACDQAAAWERSGRPLPMAVNVSGRQFRDSNFLDSISRILQTTGLSPHLLEIEVTESVLMEGYGELAPAFEQLRRQGVRIALDDFGTGYSSLSYLKRLPLDKLKIDKSFVRDLPHDADDRSIARAIVALGRSLNLHVQAEGVETDEQLEYLATLGCEYLQGYLIARPIPAGEVESMLIDAAPFAAPVPALRTAFADKTTTRPGTAGVSPGGYVCQD